jgi:hypothetical protein
MKNPIETISILLLTILIIGFILLFAFAIADDIDKKGFERGYFKGSESGYKEAIKACKGNQQSDTNKARKK